MSYLGIFFLLLFSHGVLGDTTPLQDGKPVNGISAPFTFTYFSFLKNDAGNFTVAVTPITGDPDLYISSLTDHPTQSDSQYRSFAMGSDSITIASAASTTWTIGVYGIGNTSFTVVATSSNSYTTLVSGMPQKGSLTLGNWNYYLYSLVSANDLTVTINPTSGDPDLYIGLNFLPSQTNATARSLKLGADVITIKDAAPGDYFIGVFAATSIVEYSLVLTAGSTATAATILPIGGAFSSQLIAGDSALYQITIDSPGNDLTVVVTALVGDPDLYIKFGSPPTSSVYDYTARAYKDDGITIPSEDLRLGNYYILVEAFMNTTYVLTASLNSTVHLQNGVAQSGTVRRETMIYYYYRLSATSVTFLLTPQTGNPSLYVGVGFKPTAYNYTWAKLGTSSTLLLKIEPTDSHYCNLGTNPDCVYYIGIYGQTQNSSYILTASSQEGIDTLQDGVPVHGSLVAGTWKYYQLTVLSDNVDVAISVTAISGDPDLYVSHLTTQPNEANYEYTARTLGADTVHISNRSAATWYIGVAAFLNATYTLTASISGSSTLLVDGVPQTGSLPQFTYHFYYFNVAPGASQFSVTVAPSIGDPDLYINNNGTKPSKETSTWHSISYGRDVITITNPSPGRYDIAVYASFATDYSIVATGDSTQLVQFGVPIQGAVDVSQFVYYKLSIVDLSSDLTITVTALTGDPDIYLGYQYKPNMSVSDQSARAYRDDSITIPTQSLLIGDYYIGITAWSNSAYILTASLATPIALHDGQGQSGSVHPEQIIYYYFSPPPNVPISFTLSPKSGNAYLLVTVGDKPTANNATWTAINAFSTNTLTIKPGDYGYCVATPTFPCTYFVGVYGATNATFTITASTSNSSNILQDGQPVQVNIPSQTWKYYQYELRSANVTLVFSVTPLSGDPDLYISQVTDRPDMDHYQYASRLLGGDTLRIPNAAVGIWYVGVYAFINTTCTLVASTVSAENVTVIHLVDGVPQSGLVAKADYSYYHFTVGHATNQLTVTVSPSTGDPDLYISNVSLPSTNVYVWRSIMFGRDTISIPNPSQGDYKIAVYGSSTSEFSIVATTDSIEVLPISVPARGDVTQNEKKYYQLAIADTSEDLTFTVTTLSGDPDLYIAFGYKPSADNYTYAARFYGDDSVTIPTNKLQVGTYYVLVTAMINSSYVLTATLSDTIYLQDGLAQAGTVNIHQIKYFSFRTSIIGTTITFTQTPKSGNPYLYAAVGFKPTTTNFTWWAYGSYSTSSITIKPDDSHYCVATSGTFDPCVYYVGVYGATNSSFTITATTTNVSTVLQDGQPVQMHLDAVTSKYFQFSLLSPATMTISVTPISGDPDLYVSQTNPRPSANDYQYTSRLFGADTLKIENASIGIWYISVFAFLNTTCTLVLTTSTGANSTSILLIDGVPQSSSVAHNTYTRYRFVLGHATSQLSFTINPTSGDPDLYISMSSEPTVQVYDWRSINYGRDVITISAPAIGTYYLAVYGSSNSEFSILAVTDSSISLQLGVPFQGILAQFQTAYFKLHIDDTSKDLTLTLTALSGDPDLYVSFEEKPTSTNYTYAARAYRDDALTIPSKELRLGDYYIGVTAFLNASYILTAITTGMIRLQDGLGQSGSVVKEQTVYYSFRPTQQDAAISFTLVPRAGNAYLFVAVGFQPTPSNSTWSAMGQFSTVSIVIHSDDKHYCIANPGNDACTYYIGVYGVVNCTYALTAATSQASNVLQEGQPVQISMGSQTWRYFQFFVPSPGLNLTVSATPIFGDPDLYLSNIGNPSPTSYNYTARVLGADTLTVGDVAPGNWYIGVFAFINTTFTLLAYTSNPNSSIHLIEGVPQTGVVSTNQYARYHFTLGHAATQLVMTLTASSGDPDLFVSNTSAPNITNYVWRSVSFGRDSITIVNPVQGTYEIAVYGSSPAQYTLVVTTENSTQLLQLGVPVRGDIIQNAMVYYRLVISDNSQSLTINVMALTGDPDIFLGYGFKPTQEVYNKSARAYRDDSITVPADELLIGDYYIGIFAFMNTAYVLTASANSTIRLLDGVSQAGSVLREQTVYYAFIPAQALSTLSFSLTPRTGSQTLLVAVNYQPTRTNFTWIASAQFSSASINVYPQDPHYCVANGAIENCVYYIGVYGDTNSNFTVSASTSGTTYVLQEGQPTAVTVPINQWRYFQFFVAGAGINLTISTTILSGDPDVYVSNIGQPTLTSYNYTTRASVADILTIPYAEPGPWYIGVYGQVDTSCTILVTTKTETRNVAVQLIDGVPQVGSVAVGQYSYYYFSLGHTSSQLFITVTPTSGDPDLYVSNLFVPNITHYTWFSMAFGHDQVVITNPVQGDYEIAVFGSSRSEFSIVATTDSTQVLLVGSPYRGEIPQDQYAYFKLTIQNTTEDLTINVMALSGDPDVFLAYGYKPTKSNFSKAARAYRDDSISVPSDELIVGDYYIGVYAWLNSSYILTASLSTTIRLQNGVSQVGAVLVEQMVYYSFRPTENGTQLITLTPRTGNPDLYVKVGTKPTPSNSTWSALGDYSASTVTIHTDDTHYCVADPGAAQDNCVYYIGVYGVTDSSYTVVASSQTASNVLEDGKPFQDRVEMGSWRYYQFSVQSNDATLTISLTPLNGDPDLYISSNNSKPNDQNAQYKSKVLGADTVVIPNSPKVTWYIGVYAFLSSTYTILASTAAENAPTLLIDGVPQAGSVGMSSYQNYRFDVGHNTSRIIFSVTPTFGDPDLYVKFNDTPTQNSFDYRSITYGSDRIEVPEPKIGHYYVSVFGSSRADYSIIASTDSTPTLQLGVAVEGSLTIGEMSYYRLRLNRVGDLTVTVTSFSGDPDLYVGYGYKPNTTKSDYFARAYLSDSITIPESDVKLGDYYYIGVYSFVAASFSLIATLDPEITLAASNPQSGHVPVEGTDYYRYQIDRSSFGGLTIALTGISGNAYLLVSHTEAPDKSNASTYQWSSRYPGASQVITINSDDPQIIACASPCYLTIGVVGITECNYTIVVNPSDALTQLQAGVPQRVYVNHNFSYYYFSLKQNSSLSITVTPLTGDVDLYVSTSVKKPVPTNANWTATVYGSDTITILTSDPAFVIGDYYIGVYSIGESTATLVVQVNSPDSRYTTLLNGAPQRGSIDKTQTGYYKFYIQSERDVIITLTAHSGDPDMWVRNDGQVPSPTNFAWHAAAPGSDQLTLSACTYCSYDIAVTTNSGSSEYTIIATTGAMPELLASGVPAKVVLDSSQSRYFSFIIDKSDQPLIISSTIVSGDIDLYVSNVTVHPNASTAIWKSVAFGSDRIMIENPSGVYYISAFAFLSGESYLVATNGPILLINGQPHSDEIDTHTGGRMYQFQIPSTTSPLALTIALDVRQGEPFMYISESSFSNSPNSTYNQYSTDNPNPADPNIQRYAITIPTACSSCSYMIWVASKTGFASYSIVALYGNDSILLLSGSPYTGSVSQEGYAYFRGMVSDSGRDSLNIAVTTLSGDVDVCLSYNNSQPRYRDQCDESTYTHDTTAVGDHITIPHPSPGVYFISVYGWKSSKFVITLSTDNILLTAGIPQLGHIPSGGTAYYVFNLNADSPISMSFGLSSPKILDPNIGDKPTTVYQLYITSNRSDPRPTAASAMWHSTIKEGETFTISPSNDKNYCYNDCTYYLALAGPVASNYTIGFWTPISVDQLISGVSASRSVSNGQYKYFSTFIPGKTNYDLLLETCDGNADLYVSPSTYKPTKAAYSAASENVDSVDEIDFRNPESVDTTYFVGVYGKGDSTFILTSYSESEKVLAVASATINVLNGESEITLTFASANSTQAGPLTYTVHWFEESTSVVLYSYCGLALVEHKQQSLTTSATGILSITNKELDPSKIYKANIVVQDQSGHRAIYLPVHAIQLTGPWAVPLWVILAIGIPLSICVIAVIFYWIRKYRKLEKDVKTFEMEDIPFGAVKRAIERTTRPYDRLHTQERDEDDPVQDDGVERPAYDDQDIEPRGQQAGSLQAL